MAEIEPKMAETEQQNQQQIQEQQQKERKSLYVGDLDPTVNAVDLYIVFSKVSSVTNVRVCYDIWGHSLCYGYVNFFSSNEAAKAMSMLNHTNVKGKPMRIMWCERNPIIRKTGKANLFVKNLDSSIDSARLDSIFSKFGTVLSCKVAEDGNGKSKGFGFVQFDQEESAMTALNSLHDTLLEGKKLYVSKFMKSSQSNQTFTNLYVKNLRKDVSEDDLKEKFSKYGKVNSAAIMRDDLGISKGYGFVSFESPEDAKKAMEALNGTSDLGCDSLFVGRAQKKEERERIMKESLAKRKACSVHVISLGRNVDEAMLKSHFSIFGRVVQARVLRYPNVTSAWVTFSSPSEAKAAASSLFGLSSVQKPLYGAKIQCMEGERNYSLFVKQYFPTDRAAGTIVNPSSHFKRDEALNLLTGYGNATADTTYDNQKFLPRKSMSSTCSSTGSSSTAINSRSCKHLRVFVLETEATYGGRTTGMKMKMNKGFGFFQFVQEESAMKALNCLHDTLAEGMKLYASNFMKSSQRNQTFTNLSSHSKGDEEFPFKLFGGAGSSSNILVANSELPPGLLNHGNTCFLNSLLQGLARCNLNWSNSKSVNCDCKQTECFYNVVAESIVALQGVKEDVFDPKEVVNILPAVIPKYELGMQEDVHSLFLNMIWKPCFEILRSCFRFKYTQDEQEHLQSFLQVHEISLDEKLKDENFEEFPDVLCVCVGYDRKNGEKVSRNIRYEAVVTLYASEIEVTYEFAAAILHQGKSFNEGHYVTVICLKDRLIILDDRLVKEYASKAHMLENAYLLLFNKKNTSARLQGSQ